MKKYGDVEKLEVLSGQEANVLHDHMNRLSKFQVSDFSDEEKNALRLDLSKVHNDADTSGTTPSSDDSAPKQRKRNTKSTDESTEKEN